MFQGAEHKLSASRQASCQLRYRNGIFCLCLTEWRRRGFEKFRAENGNLLHLPYLLARPQLHCFLLFLFDLLIPFASFTLHTILGERYEETTFVHYYTFYCCCTSLSPYRIASPATRTLVSPSCVSLRLDAVSDVSQPFRVLDWSTDTLDPQAFINHYIPFLPITTLQQWPSPASSPSSKARPSTAPLHQPTPIPPPTQTPSPHVPSADPPPCLPQKTPSTSPSNPTTSPTNAPPANATTTAPPAAQAPAPTPPLAPPTGRATASASAPCPLSLSPAHTPQQHADALVNT